jgi:hypothetical protein
LSTGITQKAILFKVSGAGPETVRHRRETFAELHPPSVTSGSRDRPRSYREGGRISHLRDKDAKYRYMKDDERRQSISFAICRSNNVDLAKVAKWLLIWALALRPKP